ncbi:MAG: hypothetical protein V3W18_07560 [candidate division Zixibacteria bacterium]
MQNNDRLEIKIKKKIEIWFTSQGSEFVICIGEFCRGNRASLTPLMKMLEDLGSEVFADGKSVHNELLDDLEYRIFGLIGTFSDTSGGQSLIDAINKDIIPRLTAIFAEAKRRWNLNNYKITESVDIIDPENSLIAEPENASYKDKENDSAPGDINEQARHAIDRLVLFAKQKFKGEKNRKIAVSWLENPEKAADIRWLASRADTTVGSAKVILSRVKQKLSHHHSLKREGNRLILNRLPSIPSRK